MAEPTFPQDEFDAARVKGAPKGVHRKPRQLWVSLALIPLVLIFAGGVAYGFAFYKFKSNNPDDNFGFVLPDIFVAAPSASPSATPSPTPTPSATPSASPSPTPTPTPAAEIKFGLRVVVWNASGVSGIAGANKNLLTEGNYTNVGTGNWSGAKPPGNVVRYSNPAHRDTAVAIGKVLGITTVSVGPNTGDSNIEVIFVTDPNAESQAPEDSE